MFSGLASAGNTRSNSCIMAPPQSALLKVAGVAYNYPQVIQGKPIPIHCQVLRVLSLSTLTRVLFSYFYFLLLLSMTRSGNLSFTVPLGSSTQCGQALRLETPHTTPPHPVSLTLYGAGHSSRLYPVHGCLWWWQQGPVSCWPSQQGPLWCQAQPLGFLLLVGLSFFFPLKTLSVLVYVLLGKECWAGMPSGHPEQCPVSRKLRLHLFRAVVRMGSHLWGVSAACFLHAWCPQVGQLRGWKAALKLWVW